MEPRHVKFLRNASLLFAVVLLSPAHLIAQTNQNTNGSSRRLNFEVDIVPILNKFGCNSSGCHGKAEGQNGFKLSVFGSDPELDYRALTMEGRGRRVFTAAAGRSLLLQKASGGVPHGGGVRIETGSAEYQTLYNWIVAGTPLGSPDDPRVTSIEISPREKTLLKGVALPLRVSARWSDGRTSDVTAMASFQSNHESLVRVTDRGVVTAAELPGSAAVMANYLGHVDFFQAFVPRAEIIDPFPTLSAQNFVDRLVYSRLEKLQMLPSPPAEDATFLRRVYLDVIGTLPTADESRRFLSDQDPMKRTRITTELFTRPEFSSYWAMKWADLLRVDREVLGHKAAYEMYRWIRDSLAANKPLDAFARELLTAEGPITDNPAANLFRVVNQPGEAAATISQSLLGVRIACAQCHHHPYDRWSQTDYFGFSAYFAQLQRKQTPWGEVLFADGDPATLHPRTAKPVFAHALGAPYPDSQPKGDRRRELATWLTAPDNPFFARNLANRVWAHFLGRGLVEPVDDMRATNPPSNPELLDALAQHFIDSRFDLRSLIREITSSNIYQQSTLPNPTNVHDEQNYSHAQFKRLDAEVLLDAVCQVTGVPENFEGVGGGTRAIQLWDSRVDHYFLALFGRPSRKSVCECERSVEPSVAQVLHLMNSERVQHKLSHEAGTVAQLVNSTLDDSRVVDELYLTVFGRFPAATERHSTIAYLQNSTNRRQATEDLAWTMLNTLEFVFNH